MGRIRPQTSQINHFSHNHLLQLVSYTQSQQPNTRTQCCGDPDFAAAAEKCSDALFGCTACNFFIHRSCSKLPRLITHPCHPSHNLALLPASSYTDGSFSCDACGKNSYGFLFNCADCCYDIHTHCAAMALRITHASHRHPLSLTFACPYEEGEYFCDICNGAGKKNNWLYRCDDCGFDLHIDCVRAKPTPRVPVPQLNSSPRSIMPVGLPDLRPAVQSYRPTPVPNQPPMFNQIDDVPRRSMFRPPVALGPVAQTTPALSPFRPEPVAVLRPGPTLPNQPGRQPNPYASLAPRPAPMGPAGFNRQPNMVASFQPPYNNGTNNPPNDPTQQDPQDRQTGDNGFQGDQDQYGPVDDQGNDEDMGNFGDDGINHDYIQGVEDGYGEDGGDND